MKGREPTIKGQSSADIADQFVGGIYSSWGCETKDWDADQLAQAKNMVHPPTLTRARHPRFR